MTKRHHRRRLALTVSAALATSAPLPAQELVELGQLNGTNGFAINGEGTDHFSGRAISGIGDINGDGFDDLVIGAPRGDNGSNDYRGISYVVFGSDSGFPANLELATLNGTNGFALLGLNPDDEFGHTVGGAGDVNGDGLNDLLIGTEFANLSFVLFGRETPFSPRSFLSEITANEGFRITGAGSGDAAGGAVSIAGDVNGDGFDDILIGAAFADPNGSINAGASYIVFGTDAGFPSNLDLGTLNGSNGFVMNGEAAGDFAGLAVSGAGDINADGFDDLLIGAQNASPTNGTAAGITYVIFGFDDFAIDLISLANVGRGGGTSSVGLTIDGLAPFDLLGIAVSDAGDINGDGFGDVLLGADPAGGSGPGTSYVVLGSDQQFPSSLDLSSLDGSNGFTINGVASEDGAGLSVSSAGDVNGDGLDDFLVGARRADPVGKTNAGITYLIYGTTAGYPATLDLASVDGGNGFAINGVAGADYAGRAVSGGGDINGDGLDDLFIGAPYADSSGVNRNGSSYVLFGNSAPLTRADSATLFSQLEDETAPQGSPLESTIINAYLDADPFAGMAVIADSSTPGQGIWQYSADGSSWSSVPGTVSDQTALVLSATDLLRFVPEPDFEGVPGPLSVRLWDGRWRQPGTDVDITLATGAFGGFSRDEELLDVSVEIIGINDAPSFSASNPPAVNEDPGGVTVSGWANFDPGAPGESGQFPLVYQVENISSPGLFSVLPTIGTLGNLVYNAAPDVSGTSTFDVRVVDNGGIANGGVDVSGFQTFTITVNPVNDPPGFSAEDPPVVAIDAGPQTVAGWATFDPGAPDEQGQQASYQVLGVEDAGLFATPPSVDSSGNLTYTATPGVEGSTEFTVQVNDSGGTANGGTDTSSAQTFVIRIGAETLFADSFED
ncbi:MAG: Ig-like domain-containing protein [Pseudomonadota bacterium]